MPPQIRGLPSVATTGEMVDLINPADAVGQRVDLVDVEIVDVEIVDIELVDVELVDVELVDVEPGDAVAMKGEDAAIL